MRTTVKKLLILGWICLGLILGCVLNAWAETLGMDPLLGVLVGILVAGSGLVFGLISLRCPCCGGPLPLYGFDGCCPNCGKTLP